jgi:uncharacterized protein (TIGR00299 family) protein
MRLASIEAWSGASGNMFLGALISAGLDPGALKSSLGRLGLGGWSLSSSPAVRGGLAGVLAEVRLPEQADCEIEHRNLSDIVELIRNAGLPSKVAARSVKAFEAIARAEAEAHGCPVDEVHFHEIGALDSIIDIVGTFIGFDLLGVEEVWCPGVATGWGTVRCSHGELPVPAPATALMLRGVPVVPGPVAAELTTPTGAALLISLVDRWEPPPAAIWDSVGNGAGSNVHPPSGFLRIRLGKSLEASGSRGDVLELVTILDDMDPRLFPKLQDAVMAVGALDCYAGNCIGRKGRPAIEVTVLCMPDFREAVLDSLLKNSTTLGVRVRHVGRKIMDRIFIEVVTPWGPARLKAGLVDGRYVNVNPEFADCEELARKAGLPVRVVLDRLKSMSSELEGRDGRAEMSDG